MENPKIRFKGFTKDGNSVSWGIYMVRLEMHS